MKSLSTTASHLLPQDFKRLQKVGILKYLQLLPIKPWTAFSGKATNRSMHVKIYILLLPYVHGILSNTMYCKQLYNCIELFALPQLYYNAFTCPYCSVYVCAYTDIQIHHSTKICMSMYALRIYSHMHSRTRKTTNKILQ